MRLNSVAGHLQYYSIFLSAGVPPVSTDPSLTIWYDAVNSTYSPSNPTNGTNITAWGDKSATAHDANASGNTGVQPRYQTGIQNGKPNVYFDGTNDLFTVNPLPSLQSLGGYTYFLVGKTNVTTQQVISVMKANSGGDVRELYMSVSGSNWVVGAGAGLASSKAADTNYHIHTLIYDGTLSGNARLRHRIDGVEQTLTFTTTPNATAASNTTYLYLGTDTSNNNDFNGYLGEVVVYTKKLNETDIQNTEAYFKNKWSIS